MEMSKQLTEAEKNGQRAREGISTALELGWEDKEKQEPQFSQPNPLLPLGLATMPSVGGVRCVSF